jgi:anti-sigma regulatory factor (Ser/Thr protein kinase)
MTPDLAQTVAAEETHLVIPSRPDWIEPTVEYLTRKAIACGACHEARAIKLTLALHEAVTNSLVHGNLEISSVFKEREDNAFAELLAARSALPQYGTRQIDIRVRYDGESCRWVMTDEGKGFDVEAVLRRSAENGEECILASGRGIPLMQAFLDDVQYELGGRRVILTLRKLSGTEKRQHARLAYQELVRVAPIRSDGSVDWDAAYEAVSRNLSETGMALLQARLASSERVLIGIFSEGQPLYVPAEVRHCQAVDANIVELGCRFQTLAPSPPPDASLDGTSFERAIGDLVEVSRDPQNGSAERRGHPRVIYTGRVRILNEVGTEPEFGFARDLSKTGMALITTSPMPLEVRELLLPQGPGRLPLAVRAQIVRCQRIMDGFYDVGARFLGLAQKP